MVMRERGLVPWPQEEDSERPAQLQSLEQPQHSSASPSANCCSHSMGEAQALLHKRLAQTVLPKEPYQPSQEKMKPELKITN